MEPNTTDYLERLDRESKELREVQFPRKELLKKMGRPEK